MYLISVISTVVLLIGSVGAGAVGVGTVGVGAVVCGVCTGFGALSSSLSSTRRLS